MLPIFAEHHVVWNCLGVVVAGFRNMAKNGADSAATLPCFFLCLRVAVDRVVTIGRCTDSFDVS